MNKWLTISGAALALVGLVDLGLTGLGHLMSKEWDIISMVVGTGTAASVVMVLIGVLGIWSLGSAIKAKLTKG